MRRQGGMGSRKVEWKCPDCGWRRQHGPKKRFADPPRCRKCRAEMLPAGVLGMREEAIDARSAS